MSETGYVPPRLESQPSRSLRYYLGGPMSGYKSYNIPAFDKAAADLRGRGYTIISPAELDEPRIREAAMASEDGRTNIPGTSWGQFLARDVRIVADVTDGIILLPGWMHSRGAKLEVYTAWLANKTEFWLYSGAEYELIRYFNVVESYLP